MNAEPQIDKFDWGDGPWQTEPDEITWSFGDVPCRIVRQPRLGALNGYVGLPPSHPWYGVSWPADGLDVTVHGGLTFYGTFDNDTYATRTDHLWWIGFDCGHFMDLQPGIVAMERRWDLGGARPGDYVYRDIAYVRAECESLARQAIRAAA